MRVGIAALVCLCLLCLTSCGGTSDPVGGGAGGSAKVGNGGASGAGASDGAGGTVTPAGTCRMVFTFTTVNYGGRYAPANVNAVWVTSPDGSFVRTLEENGRIRQSHLGAWQKATGGNLADAVTGATDRAPRQHQAVWDCLDKSKAPVAPGRYTVSAEFSSDNTGGLFGAAAPLFTLEFDVGSGPQTLNPPDAADFTGISLTLE
jgi:hypothetical protein